ncbi:MAG: hypothetical protein HY394_03905 [Candidatus Diapherotrites archaeon]|nr:hypothetical protein [Candidatus Diapherotrites archaeon]
MGYAHVNSKGITYYLHRRGNLYYFSKKPEESVDLPEHARIFENEKTGMLIVKIDILGK